MYRNYYICGQLPMPFIKMTVSYDGTNYAGWQVQPNQVTVQGELEKALQLITGDEHRIIASGRTDAGVHALGQVIGFSTQSSHAPDTLLRALNANLPPDIAVLAAEQAPDGFHAIRDATGKRYRYVIHNSANRDVFARKYSWFYPRPLDVDAMHRASLVLAGTHDFASFQSTGAERESTVRTITDIFVREVEPIFMPEGRVIIMEVAADGFLYNMVRAIVGTLIEVGRRSEQEEWVNEVLQARNRKSAGMTAPPEGLFLVHVDYDGPADSSDMMGWEI